MAINSIIEPRVYKFVIEYVVKHINIVSMIEYLFLNLVLNTEITIYILKKTEIIIKIHKDLDAGICNVTLIIEQIR